MDKYKEAVADDKKLRMWIVEILLNYHDKGISTERLEKDCKAMYNFIQNDGTKIPDDISYV